MLRRILIAIFLFGAGLGTTRAAEDPWIGQGTVYAKSASLRLSSSAVVMKITREIGMFVKKGDVLAMLEIPDIEALRRLYNLLGTKDDLAGPETP